MTLIAGIRTSQACFVLADSATSINTKYSQDKTILTSESGFTVDSIGDLKLLEMNKCCVAYCGNTREANGLVEKIYKNQNSDNPLGVFKSAISHCSQGSDVGLIFAYQEGDESFVVTCSPGRDSTINHVSEGELVLMGSFSKETENAITNLLDPFVKEKEGFQYDAEVLSSVLPALLDSVGANSIVKLYQDLISPPFVSIGLTHRKKFRRGASVHNIVEIGSPPSVKKMAVDQRSGMLTSMYYDLKKISCHAICVEKKIDDIMANIKEIVVPHYMNPYNLRCISFSCSESNRSMVIYSRDGNFLPYIDHEDGILSFEVSDWICGFDIDQNADNEGLVRVELAENYT